MSAAATLAPLVMPDLLLKAAWIYGLAAAVALLIAAVIKGLVHGLNTIERRAAVAARPTPAAGPAAVSPTGAAAAALAAPPDIPAEHVAAIAAAVQAMDGLYCIVRIDDQYSGAGWSAQGRTAHHQSHVVPSHAPKH